MVKCGMKLIINFQILQCLGIDKYLLFHPKLYLVCDYLAKWGLKMIIVSKTAPSNVKRRPRYNNANTCCS